MRFRATVCRQGLELCSALDRPGSVSRDSACSTLRWARDPKARLFGDGARMGAPLDSDGAEAVGVCVGGGRGQLRGNSGVQEADFKQGKVGSGPGGAPKPGTRDRKKRWGRATCSPTPAPASLAAGWSHLPGL